MFSSVTSILALLLYHPQAEKVTLLHFYTCSIKLFWLRVVCTVTVLNARSRRKNSGPDQFKMHLGRTIQDISLKNKIFHTHLIFFLPNIKTLLCKQHKWRKKSKTNKTVKTYIKCSRNTVKHLCRIHAKKFSIIHIKIGLWIWCYCWWRLWYYKIITKDQAECWICGKHKTFGCMPITVINQLNSFWHTIKIIKIPHNALVFRSKCSSKQDLRITWKCTHNIGQSPSGQEA